MRVDLVDGVLMVVWAGSFALVLLGFEWAGVSFAAAIWALSSRAGD